MKKTWTAAAVASLLLAAPVAASGNPLIGGTIRYVATYQAWGMFVVPAYQGGPNAEIAQWVGVESGDLCQAGIASTMLPSGQVQTSLIAQDYPAPFRAVIGPQVGDLIVAIAGKVGAVNIARVTDLTTGQSLAVPCNSEGGAGWSMAEWMWEFNPGQPHLHVAGGVRWIEQGWSNADRYYTRVGR